MLSGTQLLRVRLGERLEAAAKEMFRLVDETLSEYEGEILRCRCEVAQLRLQVEQLKAATVTDSAVRQPITQEASPLHPPDQIVVVEKTGTSEPPLLKVEQVELRILPEEGADSAPESAEGRISAQTNYPAFPSSNELTVKLDKDGEWRYSGGGGGGGSGLSSSLPTCGDALSPEPDQGEREGAVCRLCGKNFSRDSLLIRHMEAKHKGERAFKCSQCGRQFARRDHLAVHVRIHTGEKPHRCPFCQLSFTQSSNLNRHLRRHTGEKPYFCDRCGKKVAHSYHLKTCGSKEPPKRERSSRCLLCGKTFQSSMKLKLHLRVHEARILPLAAQPSPPFDLTDISHARITEEK